MLNTVSLFYWCMCITSPPILQLVYIFVWYGLCYLFWNSHINIAKCLCLCLHIDIKKMLNYIDVLILVFRLYTPKVFCTLNLFCTSFLSGCWISLIQNWLLDTALCTEIKYIFLKDWLSYNFLLTYLIEIELLLNVL